MKLEAIIITAHKDINRTDIPWIIAVKKMLDKHEAILWNNPLSSFSYLQRQVSVDFEFQYLQEKKGIGTVYFVDIEAKKRITSLINKDITDKNVIAAYNKIVSYMTTKKAADDKEYGADKSGNANEDSGDTGGNGGMLDLGGGDGIGLFPCDILPTGLQFLCDFKLPPFLYYVGAAVAGKAALDSGNRVGQIGYAGAAIYLLTRATATPDVKKKPESNGIGSIKKSKWFSVYNDDGSTNLGFTRGKKGVYIIKELNQIVYVGYSEHDLYKTITRHFQKWNDEQQPERISYFNQKEFIDFKIRVILCDDKRLAELEKGLIMKYAPRDNKLHYRGYFKASKKRSVMHNALHWYKEADEVPF
jgi:hypothetical protein